MIIVITIFHFIGFAFTHQVDIKTIDKLKLLVMNYKYDGFLLKVIFLTKTLFFVLNNHLLKTIVIRYNLRHFKIELS